MARVAPFQPHRYSSSAGDLATLVTQPYDKISPEMQARYLAANPHNLVRIVLGPTQPDDNERNNVYTRAANYFQEWIRSGILIRETEPAIFAYYQTFAEPLSRYDESATRKGFIALGGLEPYEAGIVHRHEMTLSGPKRDRRQLLDATHAHFGQIFMLYSDPTQAVDEELDAAASSPPIAQVTDEYGVLHQLWRITDAIRIARIQSLMAPQKLVIADGHHRYETALAYHAEGGPDCVMMTFVNSHSPGLRILATHRVLRELPGLDPDAVFAKLEAVLGPPHGDAGWVERRGSATEVVFRVGFGEEHSRVHIGLIMKGRFAVVHAPRTFEGFDVDFLHGHLLPALGVLPETVRDHQVFDYVRGTDNAIAQVRDGGAFAAFLLRATPVEEVMAHSLAGGVMPQKSTDFYPKLLTGLAIWKVDE